MGCADAEYRASCPLGPAAPKPSARSEPAEGWTLGTSPRVTFGFGSRFRRLGRLAFRLGLGCELGGLLGIDVAREYAGGRRERDTRLQPSGCAERGEGACVGP